jgi:hypothetical protein
MTAEDKRLRDTQERKVHWRPGPRSPTTTRARASTAGARTASSASRYKYTQAEYPYGRLVEESATSRRSPAHSAGLGP